MKYNFYTKKVHAPYKDSYFDAVVICLRDTETGAFCIHPVTEFIKNEFYQKSANYMLQQATYVCSFLNYFITEHDDLSEMTEESIEWFLTDKSFDYKYKIASLNHIKDCLNRLLYYLVRKGIVTTMTKEDFYSESIYKGRRCLKSNIVLKIPASRLQPNRVDKIRTIRPEFFTTFINVAIQTAPEIALGVLLSFTGGLRASEVVNLSKAAYTTIGPYGVDGFILDVKNRDLRDDISIGFVKQERMQKTMPAGRIASQILKMHLKNYTSDDYDALFINRDGNPMTAKNYYDRINKIKKNFIELLKESDDINIATYGTHLESKKWATHIGRGFFSNEMSKVVGNNPGMLAAVRGDKDPRSSVVYMDEQVMKAAGEVLQRWYEGDDSKVKLEDVL